MYVCSWIQLRDSRKVSVRWLDLVWPPIPALLDYLRHLRISHNVLQHHVARIVYALSFGV